jgi:adenylate kinase
MIALLTGTPGVGKTTAAAGITEIHPSKAETLSFGRLVYDAVRDRLGLALSYHEFREGAARLVTQQDISAANRAIVSNKRRLHPEWLLVDSHAVAQTRYGWQAHPDKPEILRSLAYDTIIHLDAPPEAVLLRIHGETGGRHASTERAIEVQAHIQLAISVYYAGVIGCPLEVVDASGSVTEVVDLLEGVLGLRA